MILKPDSVSRVTPPTTTIPKTKAEQRKSQFDTAGEESLGRGAVFKLGWKGAVDRYLCERKKLFCSGRPRCLFGMKNRRGAETGVRVGAVHRLLTTLKLT